MSRTMLTRPSCQVVARLTRRSRTTEAFPAREERQRWLTQGRNVGSIVGHVEQHRRQRASRAGHHDPTTVPSPAQTTVMMQPRQICSRRARIVVVQQVPQRTSGQTGDICVDDRRVRAMVDQSRHRNRSGDGFADAQRARYGHRKCRPPLPLQKWINGQNAAEKVFRVLVGRRDAKLYSLQKLSFRRLAA